MMAGAEPDSICRSSLDELVTELMVADHMPEAGGQKQPPVEMMRWQQCENVRRLIEEDSVQAGIVAAERIDESVFKDQRLLFQLRKQEMIETLRNGTSADALQSARRKLSMLAQNAYLEAYDEFKCAMTAFMWPAGNEGAPRDVMSVWNPAERTRLAEVLGNTLKTMVGASDSRLSYILKHLLWTNCAFHAMSVGSRGGHSCDAGCKLAATLLLLRRQARPTVPDSSATYDEGMVAALGQATDLSRQDAIGALRRAKGVGETALRDELGCFLLDVPLVHQLVREYAYARDLVAKTPKSVPDESYHADSAAPGASSSAPRVTSPLREGNRGEDLGSSSPGQGDSKPFQACSGQRCETSQIEPASQGRADRGSPPNTDTPTGAADDGDCTMGISEDAAAVASGDADKYAAVLRVKQYAQSGDFDKVQQELKQLSSKFTIDDIEVLFEMRLCQFMTLIAEQKHAEAIALARTFLTPMAEGKPALEAQVRKALANLMTGAPHGSDVSEDLQRSVCCALGLQEPRLVRLLSGLLKVHDAYFAKARSTDRFESAMSIDKLRAVPSCAATAANGGVPASAGTRRNTGGSGGEGGEHRGSGAPEAWGAGGGDVSSEEFSGDDEGDNEGDMSLDGTGEESAVTEDNILLTMEFTSLSRPQAIELLIANRNDPHAAMHAHYGAE